MIRGNSSWQPLATAQVSWRESGAPHSHRFDDYYYSSEDGSEESQYVFLRGNQLQQRFAAHRHPTFCIVETGFGTGLNFLLTWKLWQQQAQPRPRLHFISIEKYPLAKSDMQRALAAWPELAELAKALLTNYPEPLAGQHRLLLEDGAVILDLWWEDAEDALSELVSYETSTVDAWYLDGFSPGRNQAMWSAEIFQLMADNSRTGATFASFTAVGDVRRALLAAGFQVSKSPGFGKKRECIYGVLEEKVKCTTPPPKSTGITPWDIRSINPAYPQSALVIGAGIAGCTVAAALARRNIKVTILERGQVANAGSGNDQGVLYTRLSRKHSPLSDFSLQSYSFSLRYYQQLFAAQRLREGVDGALCGSFHQSDNLDELACMAELLQSVPNLAQVLSAQEANTILAIEQEKGGYWYPGSGWLRPASVCHAVLQHPNIHLIENTGELVLKQLNEGWAAMSGTQVLAQAHCAILATGTATASLCGLDWLPLQAIRGQTSTLPATQNSRTLRAALCHKGYISPARLGNHCIGASFDVRDDDKNLRGDDHRKNLDNLGAAVPAWRSELAALNEQHIGGRVGYRCASPDYLPLVGPVPQRELFLQSYAALRKNARQTIPCAGEFLPGLYMSTGHGSRGLTSTPLAAEILASTICGEALPLSRELHRAISPARFIIRELKRKNG
ncbi:MAG: bifunctional tRNA (5-methylaminomethyl-2-thiouridine)(34)-methyltransferase MnmD/FAD-dependent 5-carboxymethylaminomethyl-2-thiouridine(34) oxidoreductase MnmC [Proteobacteria bacterium]|nr:bifunctional tRNA (5-methylaminomethyl-2-thiouridine)(34)-methyltransferase MnmD/FAD-dependent 5-carboxymethylaminomethyl-2-thiouridine(34) oxidoreductase MnmC [Pseudomonadota bacterium]